MRVVVAVDGPAGADLAAGLEQEGVEIVAVVTAASASSMPELLSDADVLMLAATRTSLTVELVAVCDRSGVRIVPLGDDADAERLAELHGLEDVRSLSTEPWRLADALAEPPARRAAARPRVAPRTIAVWGPAGAPGRTTVAIELAVELARGGRRVGLVDADSHAPGIAIALGIPDEGPGFAAACRQAERGGLDPKELARISVPLGRTGVDVLTGINRPSRWPELSDARVTGALEVCAKWVDYTVVDVAASLERDEEIVSDLDGPRRNAATVAALREADVVVAVAGADPVGVARFLRGFGELREVIGATPAVVLANRLRPGALGIDARGQVRRTLGRFGGIDDVWFLPQDPRSADAALLAASPIALVAPKSPLTLAIRRFVGEAIVPPVAQTERVSARARARRRSA